MLKKIAGLVSMGILAAPALAQTPAGAPKPPAELDALKPFIKTWTCDDNTIAGPGGPQVKVKTTYTFKPALQGQWYQVTFDEKKQKDFPGFRGEGYVGWDSAQKKYVLVGMDTAGGWISMSAPSAGDTIEWTGEGHGAGAGPFKFTWTKKGAKEAQFLIQMTPPGGAAAATMSDATCKSK